MAKGVPSVPVELLFYWGRRAVRPDFQALSSALKETAAMDHKNLNQQQPAATPAPISIRYTCDMNGEQVGLSHYLMTEGRKAR
jgi:modified peptide precursor CbpA